MHKSRMRLRASRIRRASIQSCLGLALIAAPFRVANGQAATHTTPSQWRAWAFGRLGPAKTSLPASPVFGSLAGGVAASYGSMVGMVRVTENENTTFWENQTPGQRDYAVLAGARSRGDRLFVVGAAGIAQSERTYLTNGFGVLTPERKLAAAFDLSAHADYRVAGLCLTVSGVLGPPSARYAALALGAELGWFGSR